MTRTTFALAGLAITALIAGATALSAQQPPAAKVKVLAAPEDPRQKTILVGRSEVAGMIIQFEIEPATTMLMAVGSPPKFMEHAPTAGEVYHLKVKPIDPRSRTRTPTPWLYSRQRIATTANR